MGFFLKKGMIRTLTNLNLFEFIFDCHKTHVKGKELNQEELKHSFLFSNADKDFYYAKHSNIYC